MTLNNVIKHLKIIQFLIYIIAKQAAGNTPDIKKNAKKFYFLTLFCIRKYETVCFKHAANILNDF